MLCPNDQTELVISDRQGVEIDYCPKCRGVWLDRGELDKIIDRAMPASAAPSPTAGDERRPQAESRNARPYRDDDDDWDDDDRRYGRKKKKRESFLSDLFDF